MNQSFDDYDDIDDFLANSGSEYEPDEVDSDSDSLPSDASDDSGTSVTRKKKGKKTSNDRSLTNRPKRNINPLQLYKPFDKFMERVIFVISGFENPLRSEIRNKALEMGAVYKADWCDDCTHLICAFPHTPKFNQVRGHGKIVKKEWIEDIYSRRVYLPWRRYALEKRESRKIESEEEIFEETGASSSAISNDNEVVGNE